MRGKLKEEAHYSNVLVKFKYATDIDVIRYVFDSNFLNIICLMRSLQW